MSRKPFRDLPEPVKRVLREQINTVVGLHQATGLGVEECRQMVLRAGGHQELLDTIENLSPEDL